MKILVLDVETTTQAKGNPFHKDNVLCLVGTYDGRTYKEFDIEYTNSPYGLVLHELKKLLEEADLIIGFNIKFDLHWIRRYIPNVRIRCVYDCQLGEFILGCQQSPYPSLDKSCTRRNLVGKCTDVVTKLWEDGVDTRTIPRDTLSQYLEGDCTATYALYLDQLKTTPPSLKALLKLHNTDLLVLEEMEYNGMYFNYDLCKELDATYSKELESTNESLKQHIPIADFNTNSPYQLSALLFGGTVEYECKIPTARTLKNGTIKTGTKKGTAYHTLKGSFKSDSQKEFIKTKGKSDYELARINQERTTNGKKLLQRIYSTDEESLQTIKSQSKDPKAKGLIDLLLRRAYLEKLQSTYFGGYPKIIQQNGWDNTRMHGQFNQVVAITGRLSSSNPNLQNIAKEVKQLFKSEY